LNSTIEQGNSSLVPRPWEKNPDNFKLYADVIYVTAIMLAHSSCEYLDLVNA